MAPWPPGQQAGQGLWQALTVGNGRQFQDGVEGALQVRHLLWREEKGSTLR